MSHLLGTLHLPGQAEQQIVRDGVHQVQEGCVLVQDVVQRGAFQPQILRDQSTQMTSTFSPRLAGGVRNYFKPRIQKTSFSVCAWDATTHRSLILTLAISSNINVVLRR